MLCERAFVCQVGVQTGSFRSVVPAARETVLESAADDALTREIEALRERLVGLGRDLARERDSQEETTRALAALRKTLADLDEVQAHVLAELGHKLQRR